MKFKTILLLALAGLALFALSGCAQDSTDTTDDNPRMQMEVMDEQNGGAAAEKPAEMSGEQAAGMDGEKPAGGSADSSARSAKGGKLELAADPSGALKYDTTKLEADAGKLTIAFTNDSPVPHDVVVSTTADKVLGRTEQITKASDELVIKEIKPGTYDFYCSVPGHKQGGMVGVLTVR